jgi:hypothetical protein
MRSRSSLEVIVAALLLLIIGAMPLAQSAKPSGAASPQEVVAALTKATAANDMLQALPVISPAGLKQIANEGVSGLLMVLAFSDPDDPMPGGPKPSKTELDAKRKQYRQAVDLATQIVKPYGLDTLIGKPALAPETQKSLDAALNKADNLALITSLYGALTKMGPLLGMKENPKPTPLVKIGTVSAYKINGDRASAQNNAETLQFIRINGRWYIEPPADAGGGPSGAPASSTGAQGPGASAPALRATATGKEPQIVAGGIQVAKVAVADNDSLARPFQADNGTTVVLWVKMPAGQGLLEIDDDASVLESVSDDKGTNIGGKFESFPDEFKDGTGGTIEVRSSGFAAPGATAILAEGSLALTVATGTRKTRVAKVQLQNDAKFMLGKTPIVIAEVEARDDSQTFTLKLSRQAMTEIKEVAFLDAKGQPIESNRTSSGYMNDAAEIGFSVKTTAKTLTLEFEAWQGRRTIKVPFKVRAGLGLE